MTRPGRIKRSIIVPTLSKFVVESNAEDASIALALRSVFGSQFAPVALSCVLIFAFLRFVAGPRYTIPDPQFCI